MKLKIQKGQIIRVRFPGKKESCLRHAVVIATIPIVKVVSLRTSHFHRSDLKTVMLQKDDCVLARKASADCKRVLSVERSDIIGKPLAQLDCKKFKEIIRKSQR